MNDECNIESLCACVFSFPFSWFYSISHGLNSYMWNSHIPQPDTCKFLAHFLLFARYITTPKPPVLWKKDQYIVVAVNNNLIVLTKLIFWLSFSGLVILTLPFDKGIFSAGAPVCGIETSLFAVVYQSLWHPKNLGLETIGRRILKKYKKNV